MEGVARCAAGSQPCQNNGDSQDFTRFPMSGTSSAAIAAALVTTGALKQREGCAGAALRRALPNTPGLWPTGDVTRADCMLLRLS